MMIAGQGIAGSPDPMKDNAALRAKLGATTSRMQMAFGQRDQLQQEVQTLRARLDGGQDPAILRQQRDEAHKAAQASAVEIARLEAIVNTSESLSESAAGQIERLKGEVQRLEAELATRAQGSVRGRKRR